MKRFFRLLTHNWPLLVVLAIAFIARFYRLRELTTFGGDQGVDYLRVFEMLESRRPTLLGPVTHVGVYLGPLYYYLLVPFFLIFRFDPIAAPVMFGLFGTATVGIVYLLAEKTMPTSKFSISFLTALLYAVSPVILESSRAPSQPHLIPFFATLLLISSIRILEGRGNKWDLAAMGISLAATIQFHFLAFPLWIFILIIVVYKGLTLVPAFASRSPTSRTIRSRLPTDASHSAFSVLFEHASWRASGGAGMERFSAGRYAKVRPFQILKRFIWLAAPMAILLFPWFLFELRHKFFITNQIIVYLQSGEIGFSPTSYLTRVLDLTWFSFDKLVGQGSQWITAGAIIAALFGILKVRPRRTSGSDLLILVYFAINILGISLYSFPLSNHYISALYPVIIIFTAYGIFRLLPVSLSFITFIIFIIFILGKNDFSRSNGYTMPNGVTIKTIEAAAAVVADDMKDENMTFEIANTLDGDTRAYPYRYVLTAVYNLKPLGVEKYPEAARLYIVSRAPAEKLLVDKRWELASFPVAGVDRLAEISPEIYITRFTAGPADREELIMKQ